eukprot:15327223-Ditylum_brightwellii.AAC.1
MKYEKVEIKLSLGNQYTYFTEEVDSRFLVPFYEKLDLHIFCDADHSNDKVTGRSITGLFSIVGSMPVTWSSKRQSSVHMFTFGAEFTALKEVVEETVMLHYHMRSMGIKVSRPMPIFVDYMSIVLNATNPGSTLNKKAIAFSYHFVREHAANDDAEFRKIVLGDNFADLCTKALVGNDHHGFFHECTVNG